MDHCDFAGCIHHHNPEATMIDVRNRNIVVIGAARSGVAVAELLASKGAKVFVTDAGQIRPEIKKRFDEAGILYEDGGHSDHSRAGEYAVVSPGVPDEAPLVQFYMQDGNRVYSEIEVAGWFCESPVVAVTGSNGKTTVVEWMAHMWRQDGKKVLVAGNIGKAFSEIIPETAPDTTVILEVSSFQLDHIHKFKPEISVLLNITPDHLNRYQNSFELYAASKMRIYSNQDENDKLIYGYDDPLLRYRFETESVLPELLAFSAEGSVDHGAGVLDDKMMFFENQSQEVLMQRYEVGLPGRHNLSNGLASALAARAFEVNDESIRESLRKFQGVEHRLELVADLDGVRWYNDSKATNVNSVWFALGSFDGPVVLIMGGRDKGNDYSEIKPLIREKVHTIIAIGEGKDKIEDQLGDVTPNFYKSDAMDEAVAMAHRSAKRGEVVLLSPACASFDMFDSYEQRGETFKKLVKQL